MPQNYAKNDLILFISARNFFIYTFFKTLIFKILQPPNFKKVYISPLTSLYGVYIKKAR